MNKPLRALVPVLYLYVALLSMACERVITNIMTPNHNFGEESPPTAPDYSQAAYWAALPDREDFADFRPEGIAEGDSILQAVDVFFMHPSGYFSGKHWNDPVNLASGTSKNTDILMANNASIFNDCRVYAPRYRQATIVSFANMQGDNQKKAIALAYQDIRRAFLYFLEQFNEGRPFILAGHSQGSYHGKLLISEFIDGKDLADKMIAAYLIGTTDITHAWVDSLIDIRVCDSPEQTGCLVNFNTVADSLKPSEAWDRQHVVCVNPLNWQQDGGLAPREAHLGYVPATGTTNFNLFEKDEPKDDPIAPLSAPLPAHTFARCENGMLLIEKQELDRELEEGNYHAIELSLFHMNIRANVSERCNAYFKR